jgi:hypothetical protein
VVWLITPARDEARANLGAEDQRFEPSVDPAVVRDVVERLFAISPDIEDMAPELQWSCYAARRAQHPMLAAWDADKAARPVPAKLDGFGLDGLLALWPSHLGYAMVLGDVVVERIETELGEPGDFRDSLRPADLAQRSLPVAARWERLDFRWHDWGVFARDYEVKTGE